MTRDPIKGRLRWDEPRRAWGWLDYGDCQVVLLDNGSWRARSMYRAAPATPTTFGGMFAHHWKRLDLIGLAVTAWLFMPYAWRAIRNKQA